MFRRIRAIFLIIILALFVSFLLKEMPNLFGEFKSSKKVIVIDPGHGGKDPGTIGFNGNYEKDINLAISKKIKENLNSKGYKVISTRDSDEYIENHLRADLANKKRSRVFISIHGNAIENNGSVEGVQVLYYPDRESTIGDLNNREFAQIIIDCLISGTGAKDKGIIERRDLIVLNQTKMPAIIVECGFLSNDNEETLLLTEEYQNKIVESLVEGIDKYFSMNLN